MSRLEFNPDGSIKIPTQIKIEKQEEKIDIERCKKIAKALMEDYHKKKGVFSTFKFPPEYNLPKGMKKSSEDQLRYSTITVSFDYMRDAEALWKQCHDAWLNPSTKWIFDPKETLSKSQDELIKVLKEINDQRPNKDGQIWFTICKKLKEFDFSITRMLENLDFDAVKISDFLDNNKSDFPYLSGYKIKPLWLRIIDETIGLKLKRIEEIPLPIDVHTARMTLKMVFNEDLSKSIDENIRQKTQNAWRIILNGEEIYPLQLDEPLWLLGKYNLLNKFMEEHDF